MKGVIVSLAAGLLIGLQPDGRPDWTQYRGSNQDGTSRENLRLDWASQPPRVLWKVPISDGLSSITVQDGRLFTMGERLVSGSSIEHCLALEADTGRVLWAKPVGRASYPNGGVGSDDGPRSTPAVEGGRVFAFGAYMNLVCFDAATGQELWRRELASEFESEVIDWQNAASPLVANGLVFVNSNGRDGEHLLAFRQSDGALAWRTGSDGMTHASPVRGTLRGVDQVIFYAQSGLVSVVPDSGRVLWRYPVSYNGTSAAASPVIAGDTVYVSRAYPRNAGTVVVRVEGNSDALTVGKIWERANTLMNHWATPIFYEGDYYGIYGQGSLTLRCINGQDGSTRWSVPGFGYGSVTLVQDKLLVLGDDGALVVVETNPEAYTELARFQAVEGRCWNNPAVSGGRIYVRSTRQIAALDVSGPKITGPLKLDIHLSGPGQLGASGPRLLVIYDASGQGIDDQRAGKISLFTRASLSAPGSTWTKVTRPITFQSGRLMLEGPGDGAGQAYFRAEEAP